MALRPMAQALSTRERSPVAIRVVKVAGHASQNVGGMAAVPFAKPLAFFTVLVAAEVVVTAAAEDQLQKEVDSLLSLRSHEVEPPADATRQRREVEVNGAEDRGEAQAASAASMAQALLEEENKELREELQRQMPAHSKASLLESSSTGSSESQAAQAARWKLAAFLQVTMVLVTMLVLSVLYCSSRTAAPSPPAKSKPKYGSSDYAKGRRVKAPKGVIDEDEEQAWSDLRFARPSEIWTRS